MPMLWKKPADMKYTDMCIYIDENVQKLADPEQYPIETDTIYNYLWLLVKALAIKKRMFQNFEDYDGYAFYSANRLYFALKKNLENAGKTIKGKQIRPIKSCLNYTKTLLYPMKVEYQRQAYREDFAITTANKNFDAFSFKEKLKESLNDTKESNEDFVTMVTELFEGFGSLLDDILKKAPFDKNSVDYKKLKISIMLNCIQNLKNKKGIDAEPTTVQLWKLPKSMSAYVKVYLKELGAALKYEIMTSYNSTKFDDNILEYMLTNPEGEFIDHEDQY